jgi:hypothetical protein
MVVLVDIIVHSEAVQVIRYNIGTESVKNCRDVQNMPISGKK